MSVSMAMRGSINDLGWRCLATPIVSLNRSITVGRSQNSQKTARKRKEMIDELVRVDHAGEYGADRIYAGQMCVLGRTEVGPVIKHMWEQEKHHLKKFDEYMFKYRTRPTALLPLWNVAGFALGAGTALLGKKSAMACTVAVESVIGKHYDQQIRELMADDPELHKELISTISQFRDEEMEHHDTGLEHDAESAPFYRALSEVIKIGCHGAIWVAKRL